MNGTVVSYHKMFSGKTEHKIVENYAGIPRGCDDDLPHLSIHRRRPRVSQPFHRLRIDLVRNV